jgi:isoleucyl-tRNA synthetase
LLASVATRDRAPYRSVLTHGFVLDGEGRKMSKSVGNVVAPQRIIQDYGADILRLWVAAEDYRDDVRISDEILRRLADSYRRVRNTARNLLGNLADFDPQKNRVAVSDMPELDRWALGRLEAMVQRCRSAYESYEFHLVYHALNNFCSADLSAFYFDIVKDRLYCGARESVERRSVQTVMYDVLLGLVRMIAPILSFTAEEIWQALPQGRPEDSVFLSAFPASVAAHSDDALMQRWERVLEIRAEVTRALEVERKRGAIGHSLDARVRVLAGADDAALLSALGPAELARLWIVSQVELAGATGPGLSVEVLAPEGSKCGRCWIHLTSVGTHPDHPDLCDRCYTVVAAR